MKQQKLSDMSIQELLQEEQAIQGQIIEIDERIRIHQSRHFAQGWTEGNIRVGWTKKDLFSQPMMTPINNRDRVFSLSSLTSRANLDAGDIENEVLSPNDKSRFYKKSSKKIDKIKRGRPRMRTKIRQRGRSHRNNHNWSN